MDGLNVIVPWYQGDSYQDLFISGRQMSGRQAQTDSNALGKSAVIDENDVFKYPSNLVDLNSPDFLSDVLSIINYHKTYLRPIYAEKLEMYKGRDRQTFSQRNAQQGYTANHLIKNHPQALVSSFNGFTNGIPVKVDSKADGGNEDDTNGSDMIQSSVDHMNLDDKMRKASRFSSIFGRSYVEVYQNEKSETQLAVTDPIGSIIVYSTRGDEEPLFYIRYYIGGNSSEITGYIVTSQFKRDFEVGNNELTVSDLTELEDVALARAPQDIFPVFEMYDNEERLGLFDSVVSLIQAYNSVLSNMLSDVQYISDNILTIIGTQLTPAQLKSMAEAHTINLYPNTKGSVGTQPANSNLDAKLLTKNSNADAQSSLLEILRKAIYETCGIVDLSSEDFGNASGDALKQRLTAMTNKGQDKLKIESRVVNDIMNVWGEYNDKGVDFSDSLTVTFKLQLPTDISAEADMAAKIAPFVSQRTLLGSLSVVPDVSLEIKQIADEKDKDNPGSSALADWQKANSQAASQAAASQAASAGSQTSQASGATTE